MADGSFVGTAGYGGANGLGTLFRVGADDGFTVLHSFTGPEGDTPRPTVVLGDDGDVYGTAVGGGSSGVGTVFHLDSTDTVSDLHMFSGADGQYPDGSLISFDGALYGTTDEGGDHDTGTIFQLDLNGTFTTLFSFDDAAGSATHPFGGLLRAESDGNFYGTTGSGGANEEGTVFRYETTGTLTVLHDFSLTDGATPAASLAAGPDGKLYGTTIDGGASAEGTIFRVDPLDPLGDLESVYSFTLATGVRPYGPLSAGPDGALYGTTTGGGAHGAGTIFRIQTSGDFATVHDFAGPDGAASWSPLVFLPDGTFYGGSQAGGAGGAGVIFRVVVDPPVHGSIR